MLPRISQRPFILSALTLCVSGAVSAATTTTAQHHKVSDDDTLIVTANRSESSLWESPATIQVIDRQAIQNSTSVSIADDLQDIPGVEVTDNSLAGRKQIRIRGEASSRVLILIDGQVVSYQRAGQNYGAGLLIDESSLERIEIVKGPYSVLYGSQAIGGVVNFITKKAAISRSAEASKPFTTPRPQAGRSRPPPGVASATSTTALTAVIPIRATATRLTADCPTPISATTARASGLATISIAINLDYHSIATKRLPKPGLAMRITSMTNSASEFRNWNAKRSAFSMTMMPMAIT